ncbi:MAG: hypothetical protein HZA34_02885 [Candidatus Pacebacteria bacterium]|nr:hypothetical protein [Candidatus Paceibacterota bacterium]
MRHLSPTIVIERGDFSDLGVTVEALAKEMMSILSTAATTAIREHSKEDPRGQVITIIKVNPEQEISVSYRNNYTPNLGDEDFLDSLLLRAAGEVKSRTNVVSA